MTEVNKQKLEYPIEIYLDDTARNLFFGIQYGIFRANKNIKVKVVFE